MAEYLSPKVYVEEIDTGPKPIEGVSTSTAGVIGMTERGPVDIPILITSSGDFQQWFGQSLDQADFGDHCYLPYAIDGFFGNGGKRVFVTRIINSDAASMARTLLFQQEARPDPLPSLLAPAVAGATSVLITNAIAATPWVRIGTGSNTEYRAPAAASAGATDFVPLRLPLQLSHGVAVTDTRVEQYAPPGAGTAFVLGADVETGAISLTLTGAGPVNAGDLLQLSTAANPINEEFIYVLATANTPPASTTWIVTLATPTQIFHPAAEAAQTHPAPAGSGTTTTLQATMQAGTEVALVAVNAGFTTQSDLVVLRDLIDPSRTEARRIGLLARVTVAVPTGAAFPAGSRYEHVQTADTALPVMTLDAPVVAGAVTFSVNSRTGLVVGDVLRVGSATDANVEYEVIRALPNRAASGPDPGRVVLEEALVFGHGGVPPATRQIVAQQTITQHAPPQTGTVSLPVAAGDTEAIVSNDYTGVLTNGDLLRVTTSDGEVFINRVSANIPLAAQTLTFPLPLARPHDVGAPVFSRHPLLLVRALDYGAWGNRLRIAAAPDTLPRVRSRIRLAGGIIDPTHIRLESATGIEAGTVLTLVDSTGSPVDLPFNVQSVDRQNDSLITLEAALPGAAAPGSALMSLEFRLDVYLLRQPDPALPSRNNNILDSESFRGLSLDPRHSRYVQRVIGTTWTPSPAFVDDAGQALRKSDNRSEGESWYIRVQDTNPPPIGTIRLGPEYLIDVQPDGRVVPGRLALTDGDDQVAAATDSTYIGVATVEPRQRTGLQTLTNIDDISIIAAPGATSAAVQGALVTQCEQMRYRFAVLDGVSPPDDSLTDVQNQRQQFDTKYAALYHPWLVIPNPYPTNPAMPADFPLPPSGHVVGIYARTDIERGVHKAPANEVVRGITGLRRTLNQEQQDILNPYPVNINVIRDFRHVNRAIRVYGGRCITTDSDWKYVNVRRLLIFIEASIDQGLQWVVFEPNAEPLWARVRRSVTNFLTLVWRNGALEGTKPEEAFIVKCDRNTMTQTDIDEGRLICLIGVAPVKPAEFVIVRIGLWTASAGDQ